MQVNPAEVDKLLWKATKEGLYMVRSNVGLWKGKSASMLLQNLVWNQIIPTKVGFFVSECWWVR